MGLWEAWKEEDGTEFTFAPVGAIADMRGRGVIAVDAVRMFSLEAATHEEAMAVYHLRMGWEPYRPVGEPAECPNACGAHYYPRGSGQCPLCGEIPPQHR